MHIGIRYPDIALAFGTAFNVNVLIGEDKHRYEYPTACMNYRYSNISLTAFKGSKKRIMSTNHRDVVWALLSRESCAQTIHRRTLTGHIKECTGVDCLRGQNIKMTPRAVSPVMRHWNPPFDCICSFRVVTKADSIFRYVYRPTSMIPRDSDDIPDFEETAVRY